MTIFAIEGLLIVIWGLLFTNHTRRLVRLARANNRAAHWRFRLNRIWWWLGQDEFWREVGSDGAHCLHLTLLLFVVAWGVIN